MAVACFRLTCHALGRGDGVADTGGGVGWAVVEGAVHQLASGVVGDGDQAIEVLALGGRFVTDAGSRNSWLTFHRYRTRAGPL